jgi:ATP-binding cassette subfamily A (ABC1) protein 3
MAFFRQTWTLTAKNIKIALNRHTLATLVRAFFLPVTFMVFLSYARLLLVSPANYGVGTPHPVRSLGEGMAIAPGGRNTLVLVDNGLTGGAIERVINNLASQATAVGKTVTRLSATSDLTTVCKSSLRGVTRCYGAVIFNSSPLEGTVPGFWNYTLRTDGSLATSIDVKSSTNDVEVFLLPLQRAVDYAIAATNSAVNQTTIPASVNAYPYTSISQKELDSLIRTTFHTLIINILAAAFLVGMVGVCYHLTGFLASERELGMSQLLEAMMPNKRRWEPQWCRVLSYHLGFSLLYIPGWAIIGIFLGAGVFSNTSKAIVIIFHLLSGLALVSWAILGGVFFKKAQLSGITVAIVTLVLGIAAQVLDGKIDRPSNVYVLGFLFAPCNYVFFIVMMARFEVQEMPMNLLTNAPGSWPVKGIVIWVFLVIQIFAYPLIAVYLERWFHGTASKGRTVVKDAAGTTTVRLEGFTKHYKPTLSQRFFSFCYKTRKTTVVAVDNLTLSAVKGQILCLLGANGSGKSTTLDAIAGLNTVTSGTITVDGTGGIGICPQKNVLWDELTVAEHIHIFNKLKAPGALDSKETRDELIVSVDLDRKINARSGTLSGGQKRKLQLGMMLTGGSAVCCVDEVSSGLDPLSRRKIWNILMAIRGERTIILTTHFLDEADLLADHIAILSKGTLRAEGSAAELKERLGGGYRVNLFSGTNGSKAPPIVTGVPSHTNFDLTTYIATSSSQAAQVIRVLEKEGIEDYQLSEPTIEDVFLALSEEIRNESDSQIDRATTPSVIRSLSGSKEAGIATVSVGEPRGPKALELLSGRPISVVQQAGVLFRKRITLLRRNWLPYAAAFLCPILVCGVVANLVKHQTPPSCLPDNQSSSRTVRFLPNVPGFRIVAGPADRLPSTNPLTLFTSLLRPYGNSSLAAIALFPNSLNITNSFDQFNDFIGANYSSTGPAGLYLGDASNVPTIAYLGNGLAFNSVWGQNVMNMLTMNMTIITGYAAFDIPWAPGTGNSLQLVVYLCLVFAAYPAFFGLYPNLERTRNVRGLEYSNGVRPVPLWLSYWFFDMLIVLVSSTIATVLLSVVSKVWFQLGYVFLVFVLFGMASILLSYVVSLFSATQLATFAIVAGGEAVLFLAYLVAYLCTITYAPVQAVDQYLLLVNYTISVITPMGSLIRALFISLNLFSAACDGQNYDTPSSIKLFGGPILYLILQIFFLFGVLLWYDSKFSLSRFRRQKPVQSEPDEAIVEDGFAEELKRVTSSNDGLRVLHLTKSFGNLTAVEDVTFGIERGEVFALLGPNGAGKSTTISLIRGDIQPSYNGGDIFVDNIQLRKHRAQARTHLGVCPQFDGSLSFLFC